MEPSQEKIKFPLAELTIENLPEVYLELKKPIDAEGLQTSSAEQTKKGYDTIGYGYAWITERLNDIIGMCWRTVSLNEKIEKAANGMWECEVDVSLQLGNWTRGAEPPNPFFHSICERVGFGWNRSFNKVDARKGAYTNGLKKAAALYGIGNDAYKKAIDEENLEVKEVLSRKGKKPATPAKPAPDYVVQLKTKLTAMGAKTEKDALNLLAERTGITIPSFTILTAKSATEALGALLQSNQK